MFRVLSSKFLKVVSPVCMLGGMVYFGIEEKDEDKNKCGSAKGPTTAKIFQSLEFRRVENGERIVEAVSPLGPSKNPDMKILDLYITPVNQDIFQPPEDIQKLSIKVVPKKKNGVNITALGEGDKGPYLLECQGSIRTSDGVIAVPLILFLQDKWALELMHHTLEENIGVPKPDLHSFGILSFYGLASRKKGDMDPKNECHHSTPSKCNPADDELPSSNFGK